jgi:Uncharacterized proteins, homologs of microcin C7 resistance protein MccF
MIKPYALKKGDHVAIVSLSAVVLGEKFAKHELNRGKQRIEELGLIPEFMPNSLKGIEFIKNHPKKRAEDLKRAFADDQIKGIFCAIGGEDTYRLAPYLLDDPEFVQNVRQHPKLFTGFSDTTVNHLMLYQLGLTTFYGPNVINDLAELDTELLPYTKKLWNITSKIRLQLKFSAVPLGMKNELIFQRKLWIHLVSVILKLKAIKFSEEQESLKDNY